MNDYRFGNFLCALREGKELTQAELAQILSVTPAAVFKWENGESKPRIETLFKLAEILDVTVEELMAGEFILKEEEPEIFDQNRKRYEYLKSLDSLLTAKVRMTRIYAFILDWCIMGSLTMVLGFGAFLFYPMQGKTISDGAILILLFAVLISVAAWIVCFVLRDFIFKGRSPGKRIFGLTVIDRNTGEEPSKKQLKLRNLFFFLYSVDGIVMLVRGMSIGDSVAQTLVVSKNELEENKAAFENGLTNINTYRSGKKEKKRIIIFLLSGVVIYVLMATVLFSAVHGLEKSEPYQAAYSYLIESDSFKELNVNEDRVKWTSISGKGIIVKGDTNEIVFSVEGREYEVVTHNENGEWKVCEECTLFR